MVLRIGRIVSVLNAVTLKAKRLLVRHHLHYAILLVGVLSLEPPPSPSFVEEARGGTIEKFRRCPVVGGVHRLDCGLRRHGPGHAGWARDRRVPTG